MIERPPPGSGRDPDARHRIVVLRALGLGDLCAGVPALRALRCAHPDAELVLAAPSWQEPLARLAGVDRVVDTAPLAPLEPSLHDADLAVNLHGRGPQSTRLLAATTPRRLVAFAHREVDAPIVTDVTWRPDEHERHRWCRLLQESGIDADPADLHLPAPDPEAVPFARSDGSTSIGAQRTPDVDVRDALVDRWRSTSASRTGSDGRWVVVHPGAAAPGRRWPAERFGAVVAALAGAGHRVVLTGSAGERSVCDQVVAAAGPATGAHVEVLAGETDLVELAATIGHADLLVANDTGAAHLAAAFGTPSVVLFGPTPPDEWGPPSDGPHVALWAGRRGDPHAEVLDPGLAALTVDDVLAAVEEVTARVPA